MPGNAGFCASKKTKTERRACPLRGWGAGIRTPIGRSRVGSPTVERHPIETGGRLPVIGEEYNTLTFARCQAAFEGVRGREDKKGGVSCSSLVTTLMPYRALFAYTPGLRWPRADYP